MPINLTKQAMQDVLGVKPHYDYFLTRRDGTYYAFAKNNGIAYQGTNFVSDVFQPCLDALPSVDPKTGGTIFLDKCDFEMTSKPILKRYGTHITTYHRSYFTSPARLIAKNPTTDYMLQVGLDANNYPVWSTIDNILLFADDSVGSPVVARGIDLFHLGYGSIKNVQVLGNKMANTLRIGDWFHGTIESCDFRSGQTNNEDCVLFEGGYWGLVNLATFIDCFVQASTNKCALKVGTLAQSMRTLNWYGGQLCGWSTYGLYGFQNDNQADCHAKFDGCWFEYLAKGLKLGVGGPYTAINCINYGAGDPCHLLGTGVKFNYMGLQFWSTAPTPDYGQHGTVIG